MKSKILILSRFVKEYEPLRLKQEAEKAGYECDIIKYGQIEFGVKEGVAFIDLKKGRKLADYSYIIPRASSKKGSSMVAVKNVILEEARNLNIPILNSTTFEKYPLLGKMEQGVLLSRNNIPTIDYLSFGSQKGFSQLANQRISELANLRYPLILKGRFGSHGRTVKVINSISQLQEMSKEYKGDSVLIQPLLNVKQWYRCIVVKNKMEEWEYLGEMRHRQKAKYKHSDFDYSTSPLTKLSTSKMQELQNICVRSAKLFDCDYCGIDVLYCEDTKSFVVSEVNRTAQFKYFEKRVEVNVASTLILKVSPFKR